jgi:hypothetical protein
VDGAKELLFFNGISGWPLDLTGTRVSCVENTEMCL